MNELKTLASLRRASRRGMVLIFVAGILTILAALGTAFFATTHSATLSAVRFSDMVRADLLAQSGIHEAVTRLRLSAYIKTEDPTDSWYTTDWFNNAQLSPSFQMGDGADSDSDGIVDNEVKNASGITKVYKPYARALTSSVGDDSDRFILEVEDAGGKININACDNLAVVLDNLCRLIGPPLVAARGALLQPRRWGPMPEGEGGPASYGANTGDQATARDLYYSLDGKGYPVQRADGTAVYGDGYAIAGYRGRNGPFNSIEELKGALTFVDRNGSGIADDPLERMEIEVKYAALKPYITLASWVDTTTSCVGKFEWVRNDVLLPVADLENGSPIRSSVAVSEVNCQVLIDRDKSWVADSPVRDPQNHRGSLRGSYVSIMNGHGAGQLRRIATNGTDWIAIRSPYGADERMTVAPGPISSYMIIAAEDAVLGAVPNTSPTVYLPQMNADGTLIDHPLIDYANRPLCIHRSPVNINTASDKVLAAILMGLNVQHGHFLSLGTNADFQDYDDRARATAWYKDDPHAIEPYLLTFNGLKRLPAELDLDEENGILAFDRPAPGAPVGSSYAMGYLNNYGTANRTGLVNEAVELAQRILIARSKDASLGYFDAAANAVYATTNGTSCERRPFTSWDDLYFRVVKPWDDKRREDSKDAAGKYHKRLIAKILMANANPNSDILKFNPNIEWIDRWGRNFVDMEPIMIYTDKAEPHNSNPTVADPVTATSIPIYSIADRLLKSSQCDAAGKFIQGAYIIRAYRYRSDDLIDKTDLNRSTTEMAFNSNGIFQITSTGQVVHPLTGQLLAERKTEAAVKVYDVWTESTQRQFVNGKISLAHGARGTASSGQIARDAHNVAPYNGQADRLALNTLPEPLVPFTHRIENASNSEVVTQGGSFLDAYGNVRANPIPALAATSSAREVPDVVANRILPAQWDGQIVLATNTSAYDPNGDKDTFLATFDGDLDTADCAGNGREQAKTPHRADNRGDKVRVVDTFGLLGLLNDTTQDADPGLPLVNPADPVNGFRWVYRFMGMNAALKPLNPAYYWNNVTTRMGDLRTDGVFLSSPGVAGNDATIKYLFDADKKNFDPASKKGNDITLWFKSTWHQDDFRTHEFFNASNPSSHIHAPRGCYLIKYGQYVFSYEDFAWKWGHSANRTKTNVLAAFWEVEGPKDYWYMNGADWDMGGFLHGGYDNVPKTLPHHESPSFRIQPFRWQFTGMRRNALSQSLPSIPQGDGQRGHWIDSQDYDNPKLVDTVTHHIRPFIDSQLHPEGETTWKRKQFFCFRTEDAEKIRTCVVGDAGEVSADGWTGQDVKWQWADPSGTANTAKVFSINNLNFGNNNVVTNNDDIRTHYRFMPEDGTYAVIDELKISSRDRILRDAGAPDWANDRVVREQSLSRYYLPPHAADENATPQDGGPPTFTSQTLLQSRRGFDRIGASEVVTLVRVTWTVFTPRFMHEYKVVSNTRFNRTEYVTYNGMTGGAPIQNAVSIPFKGPFDYEVYNDSAFVGDMGGDGNGRTKSYISVARPTRAQYGGDQAHATKGLRVHLLRDPDTVTESGDEVVLASFTNPDDHNPVGTVDNPTRVQASQLRYRLQFLYPRDALVDPIVDPAAGGKWVVNPSQHYLLDTPVFDDIAVTYISRTRFLDFRPVFE